MTAPAAHRIPSEPGALRDSSPPPTAPPIRRRRGPASAYTPASSGGAISAVSSVADVPADPAPLTAPPAAAVYRNPAFVPFPNAEVPTHMSAPASGERDRSASGSRRSADGGLAALEALRDRLEVWRTSPIPPIPDPSLHAAPTRPARAAAARPSHSMPPAPGSGSDGHMSLPGSRTVSFLDSPQQWQGGLSPIGSGTETVHGGGGAVPHGSKSEAAILERLKGPMSAWHAAHAQDGRAGSAWQKIPDLLIKYGGPGQLMGHQDVWSDDGEPEEMDAPPLRPGAHSPTGRIQHVSQAVYQAQESRVARQSAGAAGSVVGGMSSLGGAGGCGSDDDERWLKVQQKSEASTPVADLAKRLAHLRSRRG